MSISRLRKALHTLTNHFRKTFFTPLLRKVNGKFTYVVTPVIEENNMTELRVCSRINRLYINQPIIIKSAGHPLFRKESSCQEICDELNNELEKGTDHEA